MTKPNAKTSRARSPRAKPAKPAGEAMFDDAPVAAVSEAPQAPVADDPAPVVPADQASEVVSETSPDEPIAGAGPEEVREEPALLEVLEEQVADTEPDGEQLFDEVFGKDEEPEPEPSAPEPEPAPEPAVSSDGPERVRMGQVEGLLIRVPIESVGAILGEPALERVELLRGSESVHDLQKRMRATDGRCAPMIFTETPGDPPILFSGIDSYAAALNCGLRNLSVITISPTDAGAAQSWVAQQQAKPANVDDDLLHRVYADGLG